jgi:hypothetical protein
MNAKFYRWAIAILTVSLFPGCYPNGADYTEELDLVYTNYSSDFNFKSKQTYAMPDSVIKITGEQFNDPNGSQLPQFVSSDYSTAIRETIKQNMAANGWTLVDKFSNPDVIILPSTMTTTNIYYYYDWAYWGWYYPGYYPGWGWYYPGSYYPTYVEGYRSGSLFIQMLDHTTASPDGDNISVVWNCIINGLAEGSSSSITSRLQQNINKAFSQSPYLKH